ncbi:hypothetical protein AFAEC_1651 [Aliarcobacter faecis]|nr:hypothetical protein AFAEC_1651 [Aliarcobacter faecis]
MLYHHNLKLDSFYSFRFYLASKYFVYKVILTEKNIFVNKFVHKIYFAIINKKEKNE